MGKRETSASPYLGYYVLLMVIVFVIIFGGIFALGASEVVFSGNLVDTQAMLLDKLGILAMVGILVILFLAFIAQVNILAKRIRDMGLPVLWTILGIVLLSMLLNTLFPPEAVSVSAAAIQTADGSATTLAASTTTTNMIVQIFDMVIFLCLLFIPSNTFNNKNHY